jgi:hypothetical protein
MQASEPVGLPAPTGRHRVGRASFDWVDPDRAELYSSNPRDRRELVVWIWYPAEPGPGAVRAAYLPEPWMPTGQFLGLDAAGLLSHAVEDAPVAGERSSYPVLVLSPSGFPPLLLAAIAEDLASHGYVVVGVNHTYETAVTAFSDGRVVPMNPAAIAGALGPQSGPYLERFAQRAAVCDYKAADLAAVADRLERLSGDGSWPLAGRPDPTGQGRRQGRQPPYSSRRFRRRSARFGRHGGHGGGMLTRMIVRSGSRRIVGGSHTSSARTSGRSCPRSSASSAALSVTAHPRPAAR